MKLLQIGPIKTVYAWSCYKQDQLKKEKAEPLTKMYLNFPDLKRKHYVFIKQAIDKHQTTVYLNDTKSNYLLWLFNSNIF